MWFAAGGAIAIAGAAWAARGRSSQVFAPSLWRGPAENRALALTFDDGPSEATPEILEVLDRHHALATFFQIGENAARLPAIAATVSAAGHEPGNHTWSHPRLWLRSGPFIAAELTRAQEMLTSIHGRPPRLFRAPYGVRWPGLRAAQNRLGLTGIMWTIIGKDWALPADGIVRRVCAGVRNGAIVCLHDGRERMPEPDVRPTIAALRVLLPVLRDQGYELKTVSCLLCPKNSHKG
jgi:peptidoglycan/xylan/chitin deacetylase (PgdA/CDA1 family)